MKVRKEFLIVVIASVGLFSAAFYEAGPIETMMDWKASMNTQATHTEDVSSYSSYDHTEGATPLITVDFRQGKHFWNPQVVIWLEDSAGNYLETLLVTTSTAKGLFFSGRSASNFKEADAVKSRGGQSTRRVDALPYWSHKKGHRYPDGFYSPPPEDPLPDGITSATPKGNFYLKATSPTLAKMGAFRILIELNVAFDENEYYSEYDFAEDSLYHGGTGLLGQPSLIYEARIQRSDTTRFYLARLIGHGHYSGSSGELFSGMKTITTAKYVSDRIVIGIAEEYYSTREIK
jgi:hypothetical protein